MPWKQLHNNLTLTFEGFYISFAPDPILADDAAGETALCVTGAGPFTTNFYILKGDHRAAYEQAGPNGLLACFDYFRAHRDEMSSWSEDPETVQ